MIIKICIEVVVLDSVDVFLDILPSHQVGFLCVTSNNQYFVVYSFFRYASWVYVYADGLAYPKHLTYLQD